MPEHQPLIINGFSGLYDRREPFTELPPVNRPTPIPLDIADNIIYHDNGGIGTRPRFRVKYPAAGHVTRIFPFAVGTSRRYLYMRQGVGIFDSIDHSTPILELTDIRAARFSAHQLFGRIFISPVQWRSNELNGYGSVYLYNPELRDTPRKIGGIAPVKKDGNEINVTGNVPNGYTVHTDSRYYFSVVFETDSGFITPPGPKDGTIQRIESSRQDAAPNQVACGLGTIGNVPVGPAGTVRRYILMTHAVPEDYTEFSDWAKLTWYYAPNSVQSEFNDNVTLSHTFNSLIFDSILVEEATNLVYQQEEVPAGVHVTDYSGRLVVVGNTHGATDVDKSSARLSALNKPESFSLTTGRLIVHQRDGYRVIKAFVIRNTLYIGKEKGIYAYSDNGSDPSNWSPFTIDSAVGVIILSDPVPGERYCIGDRNGIYAFDGVVNPIPLTYPIEALWQRISETVNFPGIQIVLNHSDRTLYVVYTDDLVSEYSKYILVGKYTNPLGNAQVRWSRWNMSLGDDRFISLALETLSDQSAAASNLIVGGDFGSIARLDSQLGHFDISDRRLYWRFATAKLNLDGNIKHIENIRIEGDIQGRVHTALLEEGVDQVIETRLRQIFDGGSYDLNYNREVVKYSLKLLQGTREVLSDVDESDNYFRGLVNRINRIIVYINTQWQTSPVGRTYTFDSKQASTNLTLSSQWYLSGQALQLFLEGSYIQALGVISPGSRLRLNRTVYTVSNISVDGNNLVITLSEVPVIQGNVLNLTLGVR